MYGKYTEDKNIALQWLDDEGGCLLNLGDKINPSYMVCSVDEARELRDEGQMIELEKNDWIES